MSENVKNMTEGAPGKLILFFALPLMAANIFQQFYTMVDAMVVGQIVGVRALAAVGAADWIIWMVQGIVTGSAQGFSILVSQNYGAGNGKRLKEVVEYAPLDYLLLETDAPYLAPEPYRGKRNCSLYLTYVAQTIAQIKGVSYEEVVEVTRRNAERLFGI